MCRDGECCRRTDAPERLDGKLLFLVAFRAGQRVAADFQTFFRRHVQLPCDADVAAQRLNLVLAAGERFCQTEQFRCGCLAAQPFAQQTRCRFLQEIVGVPAAVTTTRNASGPPMAAI